MKMLILDLWRLEFIKHPISVARAVMENASRNVVEMVHCNLLFRKFKENLLVEDRTRVERMA
jgi:uncharacterized protein (DUF1015 family)